MATTAISGLRDGLPSCRRSSLNNNTGVNSVAHLLLLEAPGGNDFTVLEDAVGMGHQVTFFTGDLAVSLAGRRHSGVPCACPAGRGSMPVRL